MIWFWIALGLAWIVSLFFAYTIAIKRLIKLVLKEMSGSINDHRNYMWSWTKINNKYVHDLAHMTLSDDATVQQQNLKLLADNRRLRRRNILLAKKYGSTARALKEKPTRSMLDDMAHIMYRVQDVMKEKE